MCDFDFSDGAEEVTAGSTITFNKVPMERGKRHSLTSTQYDECITTTFDICKNPDIYDLDDMEISKDECRDIMRWLNRREYLKFCVLPDVDMDSDLCYFNASFNITKIKVHEKLRGLRLTMETDRPFGTAPEKTVIMNFTEGNLTKIFNDGSNEIGVTYPTIIVKCNQSGDLKIKNEDENCEMEVKNCELNEIISVYGDTRIITSSLDGHDISNDFNYVYFRIGNYYRKRDNKITVSLPCTITLKYTPIIKDAP